MRLKMIVPTLFVFICILSAAGFAENKQGVRTTPPEGVPVAVLPEAKYEFPVVVDGTQVVHDFILKNEGTEPLNVKRVKTG